MAEGLYQNAQHGNDESMPFLGGFAYRLFIYLHAGHTCLTRSGHLNSGIVLLH